MRRSALVFFASVGAFGCSPEVPTVEEPRIVAEQIQSSPLAEGAEANPILLSRVDPDLSDFPGGHIPETQAIYVLQIDDSGRVLSARPDPAGHPKLDEIMVRTLLQWQFAPATRNGLPVAVDYRVTFRFKLG